MMRFGMMRAVCVSAYRRQDGMLIRYHHFRSIPLAAAARKANFLV